MSGRVTVWTEERIAQVTAVLRECGGDLTVASERLGVERPRLKTLCHDKGIDYRAMRSLPPLSVAQAEQGAAPWQGYRPRPGYKEPEKSKPAKPAPQKVETRIVIPDVHRPAHDRKAWSVMLGVLREVKPDRAILIGDYLDMLSLSQHPKSRPDLVKLAEELHDGNLGLDELQDASPSSTWDYLEGNHEVRATRYEAAFGSLDGMLSIPVGLFMQPRDAYRRSSVELRGMNWIPLRQQPIVLGPVAYLHGISESKHHAMIHAEQLGPQCGARYVTYGHLHVFQTFRSNAGYEAQCCGFLGDATRPEFSYTKGRPLPWVCGFLIQEIVGDLVTTTPVRIVNGRALFSGRIVQSAA